MRSNADANSHVIGNSYTYCNRHPYCDSYPYCDSHSDADGDSNTDAVRRKMQSDAAAPSDSSAATVVPRIGAIGGARALRSWHPACCWMHFPVLGRVLSCLAETRKWGL